MTLALAEEPLDPEATTLLLDGLDRLLAAHPAPRRGPGDLAWRTDDPALWRAMADLGVFGLGLPTAAGGFGGTAADVGAVMRRVGRALLLEPVLSSAVLGAGLLAAAGGPRRELEAAIGGALRLAVAYREPGQGYADRPAAPATRVGEDGRLTGRKLAVLDAPGCDVLVVTAARRDGSLGAFLVAPTDPALSWDAYAMVDGRPAADLVLSGVDARPVGDGDVGAALEGALDRARLASCAETVGAAEAVIELCGEYLKTRRAFGRPLAGFQVLQHRFVDMHVALEEARGLLDMTLDCPAPTAEDLAACVVTVHRAARFIGEQGLHLHGGIGMTDAFVASHYYKRLMALAAAFGDADEHADRFARLCQAAYAEGAA